MRAIAHALRSIASLTGLSFFNDLAKPFQEIQNTKDRINHEVNSKKAHINTTKNDIKNAVNQNKAS